MFFHFSIFLNQPTQHRQVCLICTDMDQGEEMDRLYFDQMLLELLLRPQMTNVTDVCSSDGTPELAKIRPATILDDQSKALVSTKRKRACIA